MGTGILYAVIVLAWAVYLIPIVRAHRQETATTRSADRFADAMRVLGKRSSGPRSRKSTRLDAPPPRTRPRALVLVDSGGAESSTSTEVSGRVGDADHVAAGRTVRSVSAASRRRRALAAIVGIAVVLAVLAYVGLVQWWSLAVPAVLLVAFVVIARVSLRHQRTRRGRPSSKLVDGRTVRSPSVAAPPAARRRSRRPVRRVDAGGRDQSVDAGTRAEPVRTEDLGVTVIAAREQPPVESTPTERPAAVAAEAPADAASAWLQHAELDRWDPVPVTLPTYVDKEEAQPRSVRTIDLSGPDAFSAGRLPEAELLTRPAADSVDELVEGAGVDSASEDGRGNDDGHGDEGETRVAAGA